jgi:predicted lactoylglutathione lyase
VKKVELVKHSSFEQVQTLIQQGDTDVTLKMGMILIGKQGSLVVLRDAIAKHLESSGGQLVFYTISSQPMYVVHFNDLSAEKQATIMRHKK